MDLLLDLVSFSARSFVVFLTIAASTLAIVVLIRRNRSGGGPRGSLEVKRLNDRYERLSIALRGGMVKGRSAVRALKKEAAKLEKASDAPSEKPSIFVLDFEGDVMATATASLREEVTAIAQVAKANDEVVIRLESGGGAVPHYGLAAAQLQRLKERKVRVTVCIDRVAASGGYMMACVADHIVAAPFSIVGSIGVVAQVPNVRRLLKKNDVDVEELTAGEFKRTLSLFGEITDKGRAKFQEQLDETHHLFKSFVKSQRPSLDVDRIANGEYWLGTRAKELGLVDELRTSDEYLLAKVQSANVFRVAYSEPADWRTRLARGGAQAAEFIALRLWSRASQLALR